MTSNGLYDQRQSFYLNLSSTARGGLLFCMIVGLVAFFAAMFMGEPTRAWGSLLFNLFWFFSIAIGGVAFSGMQDVLGAQWGRPVMRLHESFASFLPVAAVLFVVFYACIALKIGGAHELYSWIKNPDMLAPFFGKRDWLTLKFWLIRDFIALVVILALALWQMRLKLSGDLALVQGDKAKAARLAEDARARLRMWSAPVLVLYALAFSLLAFDLTMAIAPLWFSTLWGGWSFAVMMHSLMASLLILMFMVKNTTLGSIIRRQHFHDIGKLMHGFTVFFAYLTYAHILTYWYGNMPEETEFYLHRLHGPWLYIVMIAPILAFLLPMFTLLPKASKWTAAVAVPMASIILVAQWLIALLIVIPEVVDGSKWTLPWVEFGVFLGVLGLFLACIFWFGKRYPMVAISDPLLAKALSSGDHH